jgi:dTDP-glucose 4,6-dehydratase
VIVVDKLTYAGDLKRLEAIKGRYKFYKTDICNRKQIKKIFKKERPQIVVNFAAETHVDRSIQDASAFLETNIKGTHVLLDAARKYKIKKFIHISSDEVYGEIKRGEFLEESPLCPNSPYAASKAAADLFIKAYIRTYSFPAIIIRPCNNYGPWQYPEKLIPLAIFKIFKNEKIPIYGDGRNIREWLYVEDCAQGILQILKKGKIGGIYNLGSQEKRQNIEVAGELLKILKKDDDMIGFIQDRPGHDIRYSLNSKKVHQQTGWLPKTKFKEGLKNTAKWYAGYKDWVFSKWKSISNLYK